MQGITQKKKLEPIFFASTFNLENFSPQHQANARAKEMLNCIKMHTYLQSSITFCSKSPNLMVSHDIGCPFFCCRKEGRLCGPRNTSSFDLLLEIEVGNLEDGKTKNKKLMTAILALELEVLFKETCFSHQEIPQTNTT